MTLNIFPSTMVARHSPSQPWHAGGVLQNATSSMIAIQIPNGAHHQDLNGGAAPNDTPDMIEARAEERRLIAGWLQELV